ncbi:MAG: YraN family protein [Negativicutes bacterium]
MNGVEKGRRGEDLAAAFLLRQGYRIIHRNWRMKTGEIDIIAEHSGTLVFCEVKSRASLNYGSGAEAVNSRKQQRIMRTALLYMQHFHIFDRPCRFDVIEILMISSKNPSIHHISDAFGV